MSQVLRPLISSEVSFKTLCLPGVSGVSPSMYSQMSLSSSGKSSTVLPSAWASSTSVNWADPWSGGCPSPLSNPARNRHKLPPTVIRKDNAIQMLRFVLISRSLLTALRQTRRRPGPMGQVAVESAPAGCAPRRAWLPQSAYLRLGDLPGNPHVPSFFLLPSKIAGKNRYHFLAPFRGTLLPYIRDSSCSPTTERRRARSLPNWIAAPLAAAA